MKYNVILSGPAGKFKEYEGSKEDIMNGRVSENVHERRSILIRRSDTYGT